MYEKIKYQKIDEPLSNYKPAVKKCMDMLDTETFVKYIAQICSDNMTEETVTKIIKDNN